MLKEELEMQKKMELEHASDTGKAKDTPPKPKSPRKKTEAVKKKTKSALPHKATATNAANKDAVKVKAAIAEVAQKTVTTLEVQFTVGQKIECRYMGMDNFYPGTVEKVENGMYDVRYDDGGFEGGLESSLLREMGASLASAPQEAAAGGGGGFAGLSSADDLEAQAKKMGIPVELLREELESQKQSTGASNPSTGAPSAATAFERSASKRKVAATMPEKTFATAPDVVEGGKSLAATGAGTQDGSVDGLLKSKVWKTRVEGCAALCARAQQEASSSTSFSTTTTPYLHRVLSEETPLLLVKQIAGSIMPVKLKALEACACLARGAAADPQGNDSLAAFTRQILPSLVQKCCSQRGRVNQQLQSASSDALLALAVALGSETLSHELLLGDKGHAVDPNSTANAGVCQAFIMVVLQIPGAALAALASADHMAKHVAVSMQSTKYDVKTTARKLFLTVLHRNDTPPSTPQGFKTRVARQLDAKSVQSLDSLVRIFELTAAGGDVSAETDAGADQAVFQTIASEAWEAIRTAVSTPALGNTTATDTADAAKENVNGENGGVPPLGGGVPKKDPLRTVVHIKNQGGVPVEEPPVGIFERYPGGDAEFLEGMGSLKWSIRAHTIKTLRTLIEDDAASFKGSRAAASASSSSSQTAASTSPDLSLIVSRVVPRLEDNNIRFHFFNFPTLQFFNFSTFHLSILLPFCLHLFLSFHPFTFSSVQEAALQLLDVLAGLCGPSFHGHACALAAPLIATLKNKSPKVSRATFNVLDTLYGQVMTSPLPPSSAAADSTKTSSTFFEAWETDLGAAFRSPVALIREHLGTWLAEKVSAQCVAMVVSGEPVARALPLLQVMAQDKLSEVRVLSCSALGSLLAAARLLSKEGNSAGAGATALALLREREALLGNKLWDRVNAVATTEEVRLQAAMRSDADAAADDDDGGSYDADDITAPPQRKKKTGNIRLSYVEYMTLADEADKSVEETNTTDDAANAEKAAGTIEYTVGQQVECRYMGMDAFYPGTVEKVGEDGTYDVRYDDGGFEDGLDGALLREVEAEVASSPGLATTAAPPALTLAPAVAAQEGNIPTDGILLYCNIPTDGILLY
jgi:hypothetical protein